MNSPTPEMIVMTVMEFIGKETCDKDGNEIVYVKYKCSKQGMIIVPIVPVFGRKVV